MEVMRIFQINAFAFFVLVLIYYNEHKMKEPIFTHKLFVYLLKIGMLLLVIDSFAWLFNGQPGTLYYELNVLFNFLLYLFAVVPAAFWLLYADFQVYHDKKRMRRIKILAVCLVLINAILTMASLKTGWYFYVDANNVYHRGEYFWLHTALSYAMLAYTSFLIFVNRKNIDKEYFRALFLFPVPQLIGSILQILFYGLALNWSCMTLSLLIVYFYIQDVGLNTDYLTGIFNRRLLDYYLQEKIKSSTKQRTFSAILIDLDDFKQINDTYGHDAGDKALQEFVKSLRSGLRSTDFVARFGGDEFYVILDISDKKTLKEVVQRIRDTAGGVRLSPGIHPVDFSMGYDIYDSASGMTAEDFKQYIDQLMYDEKKRKKGH